MPPAQREKLADYASAVRQEVFDSARAPFDTTTAAAGWLEAETIRGRTPEYSSRRLAAWDFFTQTQRRIAGASRKWPVGLGISIALTVDRIAYMTDDERGTAMVEVTTKPLVLISTAVKQIADYAVCLEVHATDYVLTGNAIPGTPIRGERVILNEVGYASYPTSMGEDSPWEAHLHGLRGKNARRDAQLLRFAREQHAQGNAPPAAPGVRGLNRGVEDYWERFLDEWNTRYPLGAFKSWIGLRKRYDALVANLPEGVGLDG